MHYITVSLAQGGERLDAIRDEEKTQAYLQRAGSRTVETLQLAHDMHNNWQVVSK
jgi:hypothetical protein